ncbi:hypothetical protein Dimus_029324 [Dionaea muscipula]
MSDLQQRKSLKVHKKEAVMGSLTSAFDHEILKTSLTGTVTTQVVGYSTSIFNKKLNITRVVLHVKLLLQSMKSCSTSTSAIYGSCQAVCLSTSNVSHA